MRDGNSLFAPPLRLGHGRLKPTYEGWKRVPVKFPGQGVVRLKPTYEGWKPGVRPQPGCDGGRLKPTYEGWKR